MANRPSLQMEAAQTRRLRYDCRCAYALKSDLEPRAAEITTSFGKSEPMIKSGRIMDICIALLLCASIFSSGFAQESGDVQALIQKLEDRDKQARIIAIKKVKLLGVEAKAAIPALTLLLKDSDTDLRENAAEALGKMGVEARAASPALTEALKDSNDRVRSNAAYALGQIGVEARSAAPALGELLKDQSAWARGNAAFALGKIGEAKPYLPSLIELLEGSTGECAEGRRRGGRQSRRRCADGRSSVGAFIARQQRPGPKIHG